MLAIALCICAVASTLLCTLLTAASAQVNSGMQHAISTPSNGTGHIDFDSNIFLDMDIGADGGCGLASRLSERHGWQGISWNKSLQGTSKALVVHGIIHGKIDLSS
jgi:hypothetical protein